MIATTTRKGTVPPGYWAVWVTFDDHNSTKPPKTYCYWAPPEWDVRMGDKLHVIVSERSAYKTVTVTELGIAPMGAEHKIALTHERVGDRNRGTNVGAAEDRILDAKAYRAPFRAMYEAQRKASNAREEAQRAIQQRIHESMAIPPKLLQPQPKETNVMIKIETYLNGKPIAAHTDEELFAAIRKTEAEIKGLSEISNKPKALKERMLTLQADIDALVKYMDER
jgi:hypothetical protein